MRDLCIAIFGGLAALSVFFLRELLDIVRYRQERRDFEAMMTIMEVLANEETPVSCATIACKTDLRFGIFRRPSVGKVRRLCYRMIKDGTLCYSRLCSPVGDPLASSHVGYFLPKGGGG